MTFLVFFSASRRECFCFSFIAVGAAITGGTASVLGGGKFANGAQTAAVQYLFNESVTSKKTTVNRIETENSILYERDDGASVLLRNDVTGGPIPQVSDERISHALDVSLQEGQRVNIISGFRGLDHPLASVNHYKYDAIDVYIEGYTSTQTARALYNSGHFHRASGYPNSNLQSAHADNNITRRGGCFVKWGGARC